MGVTHVSVGSDLSQAEYEATNSHAVDGLRNAIINGCMRVAQRGTSFTSATTPANSDDTYLLDRWILLSDGNDVVDVSQVVRATPNGAYAEMKLEVETANKQFGILTILEAKDAARFIGKTVSLSFKARMGAADDNTHSLKAVVLSWDGTADTVTSDVVNAWGATPTYVANWTAENAPVSQTLTTTEQTFKVEGISIDTASTKNIAVFIFCDQTDGAVDDAIIITGVQLELGSVATEFEFRAYDSELKLCRAYYRLGNDGNGTWVNCGADAAAQLLFEYGDMRPAVSPSIGLFTTTNVIIANPWIVNVVYSAPTMSANYIGNLAATLNFSKGTGTQTGTPTAYDVALQFTNNLIYISKEL